MVLTALQCHCRAKKASLVTFEQNIFYKIIIIIRNTILRWKLIITWLILSFIIFLKRSGEIKTLTLQNELNWRVHFCKISGRYISHKAELRRNNCPNESGNEICIWFDKKEKFRCWISIWRVLGCQHILPIVLLSHPPERGDEKWNKKRLKIENILKHSILLEIFLFKHVNFWLL